MRRYSRIAGIASLVIVLAGITACRSLGGYSFVPLDGVVGISDAVQGQKIPVTVRLLDPGAGDVVTGVRAELRSVYEADRAFVEVDASFTRLGVDEWRGTLPALNYGDYELRVYIEIDVVGSKGRTSRESASVVSTAIQAFSVSADNIECFDFTDRHAATQGWTSTVPKYYLDASPVEGCQLKTSSVRDGLRTYFVDTCEPRGEFRFDIESPELQLRPGWATTRGVVTASYWTSPAMRMQQLFVVANNANLVPTDEGGLIFWSINRADGIPAVQRAWLGDIDPPVSRLRLRFYGQAGPASEETSVLVQFVCPIPERPG